MTNSLNNKSMDEIYARMPEKVIGIEDWNRYDGIAYYLDEETWQRYSRNGYLIASDEICKHGKIYKVKLIRDGDGPFDYHYEILSSRPDEG